MRQNQLRLTVRDTIDTIVDACCAVWNKLARAPDTIPSIATRKWTNVSGHWAIGMGVAGWLAWRGRWQLAGRVANGFLQTHKARGCPRALCALPFDTQARNALSQAPTRVARRGLGAVDQAL
ncbi:MAG: hypothetical protein KGK11_02710 [Sphingomonadales bacterium]|nr:hypothetical protein [Sphingomonadales bacterium]